ncbi:hypothetical protein [Dactylosporangium sp. NPDC006015]|uniref:hypothetical protein n=1 Tax=Dactylosporangium sp. NPDC006015 TaxID=3154576 RepID=UPI0033BD87F7
MKRIDATNGDLMGVDHYWRRTSAEATSGYSPEKLRDLVPSVHSDLFGSEQRQGVVACAEDTGDLMKALIRFGATDASQAPAVELFRRLPRDWDEDWLVGIMPPDAVRQVAAFFAEAPLDRWAEEHRAALEAELVELGWGGGTVLLRDMLRDAQAVTEVFHAAAAGGEAVIVKIDA